MFRARLAARLAVFAFVVSTIHFTVAQSVASAVPAADAEIVTDRPDVTEAATVVPAASLQFENGFTWTTDHGAQSVDFSQTLVRLGITDRTEFRLVIPDYIRGVGPIPVPRDLQILRSGSKSYWGRSVVEWISRGLSR